MGANIGRNVCLYPNGADPPMTEPDLVVIHDNACVDDASLICHINSRVRLTVAVTHNHQIKAMLSWSTELGPLDFLLHSSCLVFVEAVCQRSLVAAMVGARLVFINPVVCHVG